jgi:hypothetical protein
VGGEEGVEVSDGRAGEEGGRLEIPTRARMEVSGSRREGRGCKKGR